ncbi:MAG TPA: L,D-transpeptidase [Candidatus Paceibacterota bacterium]|nr:L,D-transpeptidase [Candidatus Paceibacterota bacterium]
MMRKLFLPAIALLVLGPSWLVLDGHLASQDTYLREYLTGMVLASVWSPGHDQLIRVNLHNHILTAYEHGQLVRSGSVAGTGNPYDETATPTGMFRILSKEKMHVSRLSGVLMPLSMRFFQGYYFHSIPLTPDGNPIRTRYSHGCIRLPDDFSAWLFEWTRVGANVQIYRAHLARAQGDNRVYLLTADGQRRPVMTEEAFVRNGFKWQDVAELSYAEVSVLPLGAALQ